MIELFSLSRGECNGRSGIFPSGFVEIKEDASSPKSHEQIRKGSISSYSPKLSNEPPTVPAIKVEIDVPHIGTGVSDQDDKTHNNFGYDELNSGITPYGRALFTFHAQHPDELSLTKGEIVRLHRYVDSQWMEGEVEGRSGFLPCAYIDVIVDCPGGAECYYENAAEAFLNHEYSDLADNTVACVLFDFIAQTDEDLTLKKGEYIHLLRQIDDDWYQAKNGSGRIGLCPKNYVKISPHERKPENGSRKSVHAVSSVSSFSDRSHKTPESIDLDLDESIALYLMKTAAGDEKPKSGHTFRKSVSVGDTKPMVSSSMQAPRDGTSSAQPLSSSRFYGNACTLASNDQTLETAPPSHAVGSVEDATSKNKVAGNDELYSAVEKNQKPSNLHQGQQSSTFYDTFEAPLCNTSSLFLNTKSCKFSGEKLYIHVIFYFFTIFFGVWVDTFFKFLLKII